MDNQNIDGKSLDNDTTNHQAKQDGSMTDVSNDKDENRARSQTPPLRKNSDVTVNNATNSKIPRYVRNTMAGGNVSNSNSNVASAVSSPVQRKLLNKQNQRKGARGKTADDNSSICDSVEGNAMNN